MKMPIALINWHFQKASMKKSITLLLLSCLGLFGCAAVYTDASDANHVTYLNSSDESLAQLSQKANQYCTQYGKVAVYRNSDTALVAVFDCKLAR